MRNDYIHITLVIDKSGSMFASKEDVLGGVRKIIEEQKENKDGKCTISLYMFNDKVTEEFVGMDVNDVKDFTYYPDSLTAMNDGIGVAIDNTGKWLASMDESERPSKVMVAVFTDGLENASKEYTLSRVKEMIKHQEEKYSWTFMYLGSDITDASDANDLGIKLKTFGSKRSMANNYKIINDAVSSYRCMAKCGVVESSEWLNSVSAAAYENTSLYEEELGHKIEGNDTV